MNENEVGQDGRAIFRTPTSPSRICLGTATFGTDISKADSFRVLDTFVDAGGNFLDTAHIYAAWIENGWGVSERTVGEWLRAHGARDAIVLSTKGGHPPLDNLSEGRCSKADLEQDLCESLQRLGVDCVDVYWLHRDDPARSVGEIVESLAGFVRDGRIRSYGGSNWTIARFEEVNTYAAEHGLPPFVGSQPGWALADRSPECPALEGMMFLDDREREWHAKTGFPMVAYSATANGYFSAENVSWAKSGFAGEPTKGKSYDSPAGRRRLCKAMELGKEKGCSTNQVALAYLSAQPFPVFPIIGTSNPDHAREAMSAASIKLTDVERLALCR